MSGALPDAADIVPPRGGARQCADAVLMVRPANFTYNAETAVTNAFQRPSGRALEDSAAALVEFDRLVTALRRTGIEVCVLEDNPLPPRPDAIFPNNWISFHHDGTVVLYPMQAASRRIERRPDAIAAAERLGFNCSRLVDLTGHERHGRFLEGTGSLVLDHRCRVAYACLSPRTHRQVLEEWAGELGYRAVAFNAEDRAGIPLYHTNVMLCIGERFAVVGREAILPAERDRVLESLGAGGREILEIDRRQIEQFAGNMLELSPAGEARGDRRVLVMSESAHRALSPAMAAGLSACTDQVLTVPVPTVERLGGGSVRCMLAEVFLPSVRP